MNTLIPYFQHQLLDESIATRKMLERVPSDKLDWQPHPKSMSMVRLATHVAELPNWIPMITDEDELDFSKGNYAPQPINSNKELMDYYEKNLKDGEAALERVSEAELDKPWTMRNGAEVYFTSPKKRSHTHGHFANDSSPRTTRCLSATVKYTYSGTLRSECRRTMITEYI